MITYFLMDSGTSLATVAMSPHLQGDADAAGAAR